MADIASGRRGPPAWFNPQISLGTILTIVGMGIGGLTVFNEVRNAVAVLTERVANQERRLGQLEVRVERLAETPARRPALPFVGGEP